jgi:hypothetical protein
MFAPVEVFIFIAVFDNSHKHLFFAVVASHRFALLLPPASDHFERVS